MIELNFLGILIATFISMLLGALWYSPIMFGTAWMKCIDKTRETLGDATIPMIGSMLASLLTAIGVSILFSMLNINDLASTITLGTVLGLLIIFPALLSDNLFCGWGKKLLIIQSGYRALSVFLMALAMHYIQVLA